MASGAAQRFKELFFSSGRIPTGSVTEYYTDVSGGKIALTGEVAGPYRMPLKSIDYTHGDHGMNNVFPNMRTLAADALATVTGHINLAPCDNDNNGYVDAFIVVHVGSGGEQTGNKNDIWSAKWVLPNEVAVNGVKVFGFLTIPEDAYIGVCAHELGHLLFGWPDLYDTDYSSQGIGSWCIMSAGSWGGSPPGTKPCHPSAWCKANQGWATVTTESVNRRITLGDVKTTKDILWHVDDAVSSNSDENHPKVALMQADGLNQLKIKIAGRGDPGDPFPGSAHNTSFSATSNPNSKSYGGADTLVSITNVSEASDDMTMDITVGTRVGWFSFQPAPGGSIARKSDLAAVSRISNPMEVWWVAPDGSVQNEYWYDTVGWERFELAPAGSAAAGGITAVSRIPGSMEVWWIAPNGSVQDAYWYDTVGWKQFELAPAGSAAVGTRITAVSRISKSMELWWIAPNGSVQDAYWYDTVGWKQFELAPAGSATVSGGIEAVSRIPDSMEIWWVGSNGSIQDAYWYPNSGWKRFEVAPGGSAALSTSIASLSRIPNSMELWWVGANGSIQDAYWYDTVGWKRFELAPAGSAAPGGIEALSRTKDSMEVWWTASNGSVQDAYWYPDGGWKRFDLAPPGRAAAGAEFACVSRIPNSMEIWFEGTSGSVSDYYWYK
ncbi:hypothetical protein LTR22_027018 [Elasticomyces elasticus]|nr:hypothetical protein LTR22_027018 [Elasticomyces elasticus]